MAHNRSPSCSIAITRSRFPAVWTAPVEGASIAGLGVNARFDSRCMGASQAHVVRWPRMEWGIDDPWSAQCVAGAEPVAERDGCLQVSVAHCPFF
jgi:hypothetical protein